MPRAPDSRLNATALLSLLVAIFGTACMFWGIAGIGAVVLGIVAAGEIRRSEGRQHGQGLAIAGIVLGVVHLFALVLGTVALYTLAAFPGSLLGHLSGPKHRTAPALPVPSPVPAPTPAPKAPERSGTVTREAATKTTAFGELTLVDPGSDVQALKPWVATEQGHATSERQKLVVWVTATDCAPCTGVSVALGNRKLQEALAGVRLLRVDAADFHLELSRLGIPVDVMPGFALLGQNGAPIDYVNGGEWDADIAENIAPVLGGFVRGAYKTRRHPWRGVPRSDETTL
jgi:hypothetical protein